MDLSFVKTTIYQQRVETDGKIGEEETEVDKEENFRRLEDRPEWKLLNNDNFRSLHDRMKQDESLKDSLFNGTQSLEQSQNTEVEAKEAVYYGSSLVDRPEFRLAEKQEIDDFRSERKRLHSQEEQVLFKAAGTECLSPGQSAQGWPKAEPFRFFELTNSIKQRESETLLEGYSDIADSD